MADFDVVTIDKLLSNEFYLHVSFDSMSLALELKRRLDHEDEPIKKRLKLAENALLYPLFPVPNRGDIVIEWLCNNLNNIESPESILQILASLRQCIRCINFKTCSFYTDIKLVTSLLKCLQNDEFKINFDSKEVNLKIYFFEACLDLIENSSIINFFQQSTNEYFSLLQEVLKNIANYSVPNLDISEATVYKHIVKRLINNLQNFVKTFYKKALLIGPFLESQLIWRVLDLIRDEECSSKAFNICQSIVFPSIYTTLYKKYMTCIIQGGNVSDLIEEYGESLKPVVIGIDILVKNTISTNFGDRKFINFLELYIISYKNDNNLIYLFNIILYKCLGMEQDIVKVSDKIPIFDVKRKFLKEIHLQNLSLLSKYNIKLDAKYNDEIDKSLIYFLQHLTIKLICDDNLNSLSLSLINQSFMLDPDILEPVIEDILPGIIIQNKITDVEVLNTYNAVMIVVLENLYKMSRGPEFINRILLSLKLKLEKMEKINNITSKDIFAESFCDSFGKLSSELVSWQHINLFKLLTDYLEDLCIAEIGNDSANQATIIFTECVCLLISSLFYHSKMGDQNIPEAIQNKFCAMFEAFGTRTLMKFSEICLNFTNEVGLMESFLKLCQSYGHLKLILWQYQPYYEFQDINEKMKNLKVSSFHVSFITMLHSYINSGKWKKVFKTISKINSPTCVKLKISLILQNAIAVKLYKVERETDDELIVMEENIKEYLVQNFGEIWTYIFQSDIYIDIMLSNLNELDIKSISTILIDHELNNEVIKKNFEINVFEKIASTKINRELTSAIIIECVRRIWSSFEKKKILKHYPSIYEASDTADFNIKQFLQNISDPRVYIDKLIECNALQNKDTMKYISRIILLINKLPVEYMNDNIQNCVIFSSVILFMMLKISSNEDEGLGIDCKIILMKIFELSYKIPNIFDIFAPSHIHQLIENDFFQFFTSTKDNDIDLRELLKLMLIGGITKETITHLKDFASLIINDCSPNITNKSFQALSFLFYIVTNVKKSNMPSETKSVLNQIRDDAQNMLFKHIQKINLVSLNVEEEENKIGLMNILESMSLIINYSYKSAEMSNKDSELLNFFTNFSLEALSNSEIVLPHAKGSCVMINTVLKNYKTFRQVLASENEDIFMFNVLTKNRKWLIVCNNKAGPGWKDVVNMILENITLICELSDVKFFTSHLTKELIQFDSETLEYVDVTETKVIQQLWHCFMNANLAVAGKNEARSTIVKQMTKYFFFWLRNIMCQSTWNADIELNYDDFFDQEFTDIPDKLSTDVKTGDTSILKKIDTAKTCFEIITEFVKTKRMIMSSSLMDMILQMPTMVNFNIATNQTLSKEKEFEIFCMMFEKCTILVSSLLFNRSEMLQDRWPAYLQGYRKLIYSLSTRSNSDLDLSNEHINKLVKLAVNIERLTQNMVKNVKQDISRIASYIVVDIINSFQKVSIYPTVKFHLQNNINSLMQLLDNHSVGFMMRNMTDTGRIMFQQFYDNYKKYHKYTGMS